MEECLPKPHLRPLSIARLLCLFLRIAFPNERYLNFPLETPLQQHVLIFPLPFDILGCFPIPAFPGKPELLRSSAPDNDPLIINQGLIGGVKEKQ